MNVDFTPLGDNILVTQENPNETFKDDGLIIAPDVSKTKPLYGYVLAVGDGTYTEQGELIPVRVKSGDRIVFEQYAGKALTLDGKQYLLMSEKSVYGIVGEGVRVAVT